MKFFLIFSLVALSLGVRSAQAFDFSYIPGPGGGTQQLQSQLGGMSIGYLKVGSEVVGNLAWHPEFKLGYFGLGLDVNMPMGEQRPFGYENVVLRYVEYDDGQIGLRYGILYNVTWGHGLLLDNYSTANFGPLLANNTQQAFQGYVDFDQYVVRSIVTRTGVYALRLEERVNPSLTLGQTVITDIDGVTPVGATTIQKVTGIGVDVTVPLPLNFVGFAEVARLVDHGDGFGTGVKWSADLSVFKSSFLVAYRLMNRGFAPGYFGVDYEINPVNLASAEATNDKNGYLAQYGLSFLDLASFSIGYEKYNETEATLSGKVFAKLSEQVSVTGYYEQPNFVDFRSLNLQDGAVVGGVVYYKVNPYTTLVTHYKKAYNPTTGLVEESQYYEVKLSF
ncbi:hypothetical protein A2291_02180 [candidate division WOR-1 bacterium RIFOXYB2_FULL_42_35]|uniref:Porin domain-containing protein n=1 Tax=candidate division WOR-1 bacterium RIFOXYC2_FULL_41_25 TaxID=1802586 RepID=A0A1F4TPW0_UNCSA|nr:MAG: hypothetical protein A2247_03980 [candidate division WOR-1 bacterium RIFOXYA2_FULL_41_14]OGC25206.1 MAG: hypothetical protein A2291_02180 [candidate division WOR-1 bacterium RIFOXYB2_FULL_42_35]OGC34762.1 MAG: hypothetical protein A2462_03495 [candidate division WOR-1 bacterium RIFOXYC2_FULL_41_25]OGC43749.1 MAG: hypothetical protein A2548_07640 [candidate division WOR-1 bacterium RIFOXYD2_FULL_41_8]